jgi:hypothetical protein
MKYALLIADDGSDTRSLEEINADPRDIAFVRELDRLGNDWVGVRLRPVTGATTIRVRDGETLVSDGPFAETKDFIGGIVIFECDSLDEAIAIASEHPWAHTGVIEIRPVWE